MRRGVIALSGYNLRAVVALCRWAAPAEVPVHLAARDASDPIGLTDHAARVFVQRRTPRLDLDEVLTWIHGLRRQHGYGQVLVAPTTEFFNRFALQHRAAIEAAGGIVPLVDESLYLRVSDKQAFAEMCAARGIAVPAVFESLPASLPFVAKPRHYLSARSGRVKPYLITTPAERANFLERESADGFFFQEFVQGPSLYLLAHIGRSGQVVASAQQNLMQQADGGSIVLARAHDFHLEPEAQTYLDMLLDAGFHGLVMIEVRRCQRTGRAVMIEANPRLWGPLQFMLDRHQDLFTPLFTDHGFEPKVQAPQGAPSPYYFWSGGMAAGPPACTFHDFSADHFVSDYARIAAADLFARGDTWRLHRHELEPA